MPTIADLGEAKKRQRPGVYDDMDSATLGRAIKAKFPGQYDDFTDEPTHSVASQQPGGFWSTLGSDLAAIPGSVWNTVTHPYASSELGQANAALLSPEDRRAAEQASFQRAKFPGVNPRTTMMSEAQANKLGYTTQLPPEPSGPFPWGATAAHMVSPIVADAAGLALGEGLSEVPFGRIAAVTKGAAKGAGEGAREIVPVTLRGHTFNIPAPIAQGAAGAALGHYLPLVGGETASAIGGVTGALRPIVKGAIRGAGKASRLYDLEQSFVPFTPSTQPDWQPPTPSPVDIGIPQTTTPRGAVPGGIWNQPATEPPPVRWTPPPEYQNIVPTPLTPPADIQSIPAISTPRGAIPGGIQNQVATPPPVRIIGGGARFEPSPAPDLSPVQPIPAAATTSGRVIPSVEERMALANSPSISPEESKANVKTFTGKLPRGAKNQEFVQPNAPVVMPSQSQAPVFANPLESTVAPTPLTPPVAPAAPVQAPGILQNLVKTVQSSPDKNAETIAEHAGNIGHNLTTSKNAVIANHLLGQGLTPDAWDALTMDQKNAWVKKVNTAQKKTYKPFGADFGPGRYGRPAEEGARQVGDAMRVLGAKTPQ